MDIAFWCQYLWATFSPQWFTWNRYETLYWG